MLTPRLAVLSLALAALAAAPALSAAPGAAAPARGPAANPLRVAGPARIPAPPPVTGNKAVITDFGAKADDATINTAAIQKAIDSLAAGGGTLIIPAADGRAFLSGALFLKPKVNVRVEKDAILKGSPDIKDYPLRNTRIEGHFQEWVPALINAVECDGLKIDGEGILDGSGKVYNDAFRAARGAKNLDVPRPRILFIQKSNNISVAGLHLLNSGFWNFHVYNCDHVEIDGLDIRAIVGSPSTDGIDVDSSRNVHINHTFISNNDDCIALKGSKGVTADQDKDSPPVEHIHVENCEFNMGGSIITCGSEATTIRDVQVENCIVKGTPAETRGLNVLRLKLRTDTPQLYEDIHFKGITLDGAGPIIAVAPWTQYETIPPGVARPTHTVRNITLSDIKGSYGSLGSINPNPGDVIENLTLEDIDVTVSGAAPRISGVKNFIAKNVKLNGAEYVPTILPAPAPGGRGRGAPPAPATSQPAVPAQP